MRSWQEHAEEWKNFDANFTLPEMSNGYCHPQMAEAGLSPQEILAAATRGGARAMGRESELGTKGKLADLLPLDADPLADITHLRRISRVVEGGVVLNPDDLIKAVPTSVPSPEGYYYYSPLLRGRL